MPLPSQRPLGPSAEASQAGSDRASARPGSRSSDSAGRRSAGGLAGRLAGRRGIASAIVAAATLYALWLIWLACFEVGSGPLGLSNVRLRYGLLHWYEIDTGRPVSPTSRPWPGLPLGPGLGVGSVDWGGLLWSTVATAVLIVYALRIADRVDRNLQPRQRCNNCGQILRGGFRNSPVCPECGELPHRRRNPFGIGG